MLKDSYRMSDEDIEKMEEKLGKLNYDHKKFNS